MPKKIMGPKFPKTRKGKKQSIPPSTKRPISLFAKGTTRDKLRAFSKRMGVPQSELVERFVSALPKIKSVQRGEVTTVVVDVSHYEAAA